MTARFYSATPIHEDRATLDGDEAHHLLHVMRLGPRDRVVLFDGSGVEFDAEIVVCGRQSVELAVLERRKESRERAHQLVMGVALPKGDRQKWLVEKLTELGIAELVPLQTQRSVVQPGTSAIARLARTVIEASKQCGRNQLMQISPTRAFVDFVVEQSGKSEVRLIAHSAGEEFAEVVRTSQTDVVCAVGPEGGFTDDELDAASAAGWDVVSLGPRILRIETAAIAIAARLADA
jgi:16S rRNA (uracil1498-N3)-methyltransferase